MASSKEFQVEGSVTGYDDEDVRGDGRKKKFKALTAMKKFFTKKKDKKDSVVAVKAKSTTALPSEDVEDDDEDDDGGFRAHSKRSVLAGNRSLSEDSIFSTEARGPPIAVFPKAALSEESLPRTAFQSELMTKLNKRRSGYLDDDQDDGLPRSPVPVVTTADVILGEPLKKQTGQSGKTSNNRDSTQSLISVDSSENEEELFLSKWKSSVPARKSATLPATLNKTMDTLDFNNIQKTELLGSGAAKHKINIKPSRKSRRQSLKNRDTSSPTPMPSLNEESPTSSKKEDVKEGRISEKVTPSDEKPSDAFPSQASSTANEKIGSRVAADSKSKVSSIAIGSRSNTGSPLTSPTSPLPPGTVSIAAASATIPPTVFATVSPTTAAPATVPPTVSAAIPPTAAVSATVPPTAAVSATVPTTVSASASSPTAAGPALASPTPVEMATSPVSPTARFPPQTTGSFSDSSYQSLALSSSSIYPAANVAELTAAPKAVGKKIEENLSLSEKGVKTVFTDTQISVKQLSQSHKGVTDSKFDTDIKSRMSHFQMPSLASSKTEASNITPVDSLPLKVVNAELTSVAVLKEENKVKHQIRSRTLPAVMGEQTSPKVHRSRSHRIANSGADFPEPQDNSAVLSDENIILSPTSVSSSSSLPDAKKPENVKASATESKATISAGEPSWMDMMRRKKSEQEKNIEIEKIKADEASVTESKATMSAGESSWLDMMRRKKGEQEKNIEIEKIKPDEAAATRTGLSTSAPKSIFSSTNYLEKKRGSTETVSFKNRELPDATVKKVDSSETKSQSLDLTSQNKLTATELSSSKKETVDVELSNLGSVKASRSIFNSNSKSVGQRDSVISTSSATSTAVERIRKFSNSSSAISGSGSVKAASNTTQELPATAAVASEIKSAAPSGGITHTRGGSVKTSVSKTPEVKSSIYTRTGSIKGSSTLSATPSTSSEPTASAPVKAEAVSALKPDSFDASTAPPSASPQPSAQHVPAHVTAPPNPSLPSQTPSVTPLTFFVQPFHAYSSKPPANTALASKPAYAAVQPYSKLACTPINSTAQAYPVSQPALVAASSKSVSVPNVKLLTSTSLALNSPFALPNVSSSSTNSTSLTSSAFAPSSSSSSSSAFAPSSSSSSSSTTSSSTRAHSSVTTSTAFKSHSSHTSHFSSTSTSSIKKSPSFMTAATPSEKVIPSTNTSSIKKSPSFMTAATSSEKVIPFQKVAVSEKPAADVKKLVPPAKVPAWRTNLSNKEVKIEIIENSPASAPASSSQTSSENLRKPQDKVKLQEPTKKTEGSSGAGLTVETEKSTRRTSKVLDMVKNFQNLQAPS